MKFYFKVLLPYLLMLFLNFYVFKFSFIGMTAPHDWSFMVGVLFIAAIIVADVIFIVSRFKKTVVAEPTTPSVEPTEDTPHE